MKTIYAITLATGLLGTACAHTATQPIATADQASERVVLTVPQGRHQDGPPSAKGTVHTGAKQSQPSESLVR
jgi:hypothetical protein